MRDGQIRVTVESAEAFPDGATATATVAGPDGQSIEVQLERTDDGHFEGAAEAPRSGTYAVERHRDRQRRRDRAVVEHAGEQQLPGRVRARGTGRGVHDETRRQHRWPHRRDDRQRVGLAGLRAGSRVVELLPILLLVACLLWPIAVVLSRISVRGATAAGAREGMSNVGRRVRDLFPKIGGKDPEIGAVRRLPPTAVRGRRGAGGRCEGGDRCRPTSARQASPARSDGGDRQARADTECVLAQRPARQEARAPHPPSPTECATLRLVPGTIR